VGDARDDEVERLFPDADAEAEAKHVDSESGASR